MPFPTFKHWICSSFFLCCTWLWWHVWFVDLLGVCTCVYKYQKWLSWQCFVRRKSEDCQFSAHLLAALALTVLITEWWQPMIVKIRVTDWQRRLWHMLKLNFPLSFCLSSFFFIPPSSLALHTTTTTTPLLASRFGLTPAECGQRNIRGRELTRHVVVCVWLCVLRWSCHTLWWCVCVWACAPLEVLHVEERVRACMYMCLCEVTTSSEGTCQPGSGGSSDWAMLEIEQALLLRFEESEKGEHEWQLALWLLFFKGCQ